MEKLITIVPAAGLGKRLGLGHNKAFAILGGQPLLVRCLAMLARTGLVQEVVVVVAPGEIPQAKALVDSYRTTLLQDLPYRFVEGGKERQDSVANALATIKDKGGYVAVHDGARPFAGTEVFARTYEAARLYGAAIAAVPLKDTVKIVDHENCVASTPDRSSLRAVQTPQIFELNLLRQAYAALRKQPVAVTDDASLVEALGHKVAVALGSYENFKVTTPEDLLLAENLIKRQELEHAL
ncbi:MAG: 2-C-methyl-D-erythritol 4-phosphate cytidylyltransferase [Acidaminococcaceae bacterium]|jgi:2-C-methyl-D-erythritol 4-phosphate cytidylyltransferase|nr:2-C-methyl-D-erythritol 4-phosphate cytidylyltransferase [Acidaminococcaceae bacterium]